MAAANFIAVRVRYYASSHPGGGLEGAPLALQCCANVAALRTSVEAALQSRLVAPNGWTIVDARTYAADARLSALLASDLAAKLSSSVLAAPREVIVVREGFTDDVFSHGEYRPAAAPSLIDAVNNDLDNVSALNEIIENSIEFLRPGAANKIWIQLDREEKKITIRDNGIGMTEAQVRCFVTAGRTKRSGGSSAAASASGSSSAAAAGGVHVVPALKHLSGKIGVYGIGKYAALYFGKEAKVKMETCTEGSPVYTEMLMSNESNIEVGAAGAKEIETRVVTEAQISSWGTSWTVITISDVWSSFFADCEDSDSITSSSRASQSGDSAAAASTSTRGALSSASAKGRKGKGAASSQRRQSRYSGNQDDKNFIKLKHGLASKYFFHMVGMGWLHKSVARVFLGEHDLAGDAKGYRQVSIMLNGMKLISMDTSIKRFCKCITQIKNWGPGGAGGVVKEDHDCLVGLQRSPGAQVTANDLKTWLHAKPTPGKRANNYKNKLFGKMFFSPPDFGEGQTIRIGEAFDQVPVEIYRVVAMPLPSQPLHIGVAFIKNGKSDIVGRQDRISFEPLSLLQRSYRRRTFVPVAAPTAQQSFWLNSEWALALQVCVNGITGSACSSTHPNSVTVAEIMLIYMPSVEIEGEGLEILKQIGGFAAEQDVNAGPSQKNRWAESRLVTLWQSLVLPHEVLDGKGRLPFMEDAPEVRTRARGHGGRKAPPPPKKSRRLQGVTSPDERVCGFIFLSNAFGIDIHKTRLKQPKSHFSGCCDLFEESQTTKDLRQKYRAWLKCCSKNDVIDVFSGYDAAKLPETPPHNLTMTSASEHAFNRCVLATKLKRSGVEFNASKLVSVRSEVGGPIVGIFKIMAFYTAAEDGAHSGQKPNGSRVLLCENVPSSMAIGRVSDAWFYWPKSELLCKVKKPKEHKVWYEDRVAKCVELQELSDGVPSTAAESASSSAAAGAAVAPPLIATWSRKPKKVGVGLEAKPEAMVFRIRNNSRSKREKDFVMARRTKSNSKTTWLPRLTLTITQDGEDEAAYADTVDATPSGEYTFPFNSTRSRRGGGGASQGEFSFRAAGVWHIHVGVADEDVSASATDGVRHRFFKALSIESGGGGVLKRTVVVTAIMQRWRLEVVAPKKKRQSLKLRRGERCEFAAQPVTEDGLAVPLDANCDVREFVARLIGDECTDTYDDLRVERVDGTKRVVLSLRVKSDADLDEDGVAISIAMAQRANGNLSQPVYQWVHHKSTKKKPGDAMFVRIVGTKDAAAEYPVPGKNWHLRDLKQDAASSDSAIECHSKSDTDGLVYEILSGPPTRLELISPVEVQFAAQFHIARGPSVLRLEWKAYDAADGEFVPQRSKEAKLVFSGASVAHLEVPQRTVKLQVDTSTFVYDCDACTQFNSSAALVVSLKINNVEVAKHGIELFAPSATLVFSKIVGRKSALVNECEEKYNEDEEASYVVMLCRENKSGHLKPVKGEVRLDDENNPHPEERGVIVVSRDGEEVESIDFFIESNGKATVQLPRNHVGVTTFEATFAGAVPGELVMTVVRQEAAASTWAFIDRDDPIPLSSEAGAIAKDLRVQIRDTRGGVFTGAVDGYAPALEFTPSGPKQVGRDPFVVQLTKLSLGRRGDTAASSSSAAAAADGEGEGDDDGRSAGEGGDGERVVWCAPHDAVIPPGKPGQRWTVKISKSSSGGLKHEKRTIEIIAGSAHHLDVRFVDGTTNGLERLERDVGLLRLEVAVVDKHGRAVDQSQLGRWYLTLDATAASSSDGSSYELLPAVGETNSDKRLAKLMKKERGSTRQVLRDGGHDGSWTLPPLLLGVDSRTQGSSQVQILIRTCKEKQGTGGKTPKKKRATRTSAMRSNDEIVLEGSIELTLVASERVVEIESMVVSSPRVEDAAANSSVSASSSSSATGRALQAVLRRRTVAQGLPLIKFSVASDNGAPVVIDLDKVSYEVAPTFDGSDELYRVETVDGGGGDDDVFSLVPNRDCRRPGLYRITATYLEDRYPFAREAYEIEESVEVRLHAAIPSLLKKCSADRVVDVVSNVAGRCTLFSACRSGERGVLRLQLHDAFGNTCTEVPSVRVCLKLMQEGGYPVDARHAPLLNPGDVEATLVEGEAVWGNVRLKLGCGGDSDASEGKYVLVAEVPDLRDASRQRMKCEVGTFDFRQDKDTSEIDELQLSKLLEHIAEHERRKAKTSESSGIVESLLAELEHAQQEKARNEADETNWENEHPRGELESQVGALEARLRGGGTFQGSGGGGGGRTAGEPKRKRARRGGDGGGK